MKQQVARLSPHQNAKVFAVLTALGSLIVLVPLSLLFMAMAPGASRPPVLTLIAMPVFYLIFGYVTVAISCLVYNFMFKYIGGIEFESGAGGD
jgi:hypothetical protein